MILQFIDRWVWGLISGLKTDRCTPYNLKRVAIADKVSKVLFDCTPCMASVYGTIAFFIVEFPTQGLVGLPVWVFSLCGFNYLLNKIINR